jgi:hypothetical protein
MEPSTTQCSLRDGVDALVMSATWRPAGLDLLRGAREGWTTADLARWLIGPYAEATSRVPRAPPEETPSGTRETRVDPHRIAAILLTTRRAVVAALETAREVGVPDFVEAAIHTGAIVPTMDGHWLPLDKPRMLLADRVLALFAVDYLLCPREYVRDLVVCSKCQAVVFDPAARQNGHCGAHRISDFVELLRSSNAHPNAA